MLKLVKPYLKYRFFLYFLGLISGWPCVFFLLGWLPHYTINYVILFCLVLFPFLLRPKITIPKPILVLLLTQIFTWLIYFIIFQDTSYFTRIFLLLITYLFLELQVRYGNYEFLKTYNFWLVVQALAGTIGTILVLVGVLRPFFEFQELDTRTGYFFGLFTSNAYLGGLIRNAGFFDEPGALALWGMYALIINVLFIKNKKIEILLIIGLISTFSMAYFIQIALYIILFYKKKLGKAFVLFTFFFSCIMFFSSYNEDMNKAIFGRFEYNEETGKLSGDNRTNLMNACFEIFQTAPLFGQGGQNLIKISTERREFIGANPMFTLACDGIVGQIIVLCPYLFLLLLRRYDKNLVGSFLILFIGILQRPYDSTQLLFPLMTYSIVMNAYLRCRKYRIN